MRSTPYIFTALFLIALCQLSLSAFGQLGISLDLKKPKEYEDRQLKSEKSQSKKFTLPRRFIQNTVTHYNYVFNANNKLNEILDRAKASFKDDYSQLLPFYNYTLDATAADSIQLDSLSYKSQSGIALHDLRNDWIDNLYLLWGAAYYLQKEFDSAYLMFQYINYAFAPKEKDGYYKTIGSTRDGNSAYSISTKEKNSLPRRIFSEPPSRNEAFIWQIRNFLAQDQFAEAASLIVTLKNDPFFPKRLHNDLEEVQAYWFYKQNMWDSSAAHLALALDNAVNKQEKARWEYLLGQLYELGGQYQESEKYFSRAIGHTTDPILEIYARLYSIRVNKDSSGDYIDKNIEDLLKMARRDKYEEYRDIIYYMAAQMQLERNNIEGAMPLLLKSTQFSNNNPSNRNKAFLKLAELSFAKKLYRPAYNFYDSLRLDDPELKDPQAILDRKEMLGRLADNIEIIYRNDSMQRIAAMPEDERREFVRKLARQLRKAQGLKEDGSSSKGAAIPFSTQPATNLFGSNESRGEWYFYNASLRNKGSADFKARWGNRPNQDNWRRAAAGSSTRPGAATPVNTGAPNKKDDTTTPGDSEITFENLYDRLPLTPELLQQSNDSIQSALFRLGKGYIQDIEDCSMGTETLEELRTRFPQFNPMDEVLFNLYYCYNKNGESAKAAAIKKLMGERYDSSNYTTIVTTGKNPFSKDGNADATRTYEAIYDLFIEGNFEEAVAQKKMADSLYSHNYWTPQLLYIEAVYYIRQREDSVAVAVLNEIVNRFPGTPLSSRATNLINILGRRNQIEEELRNLVVNRPPEDTIRRMENDTSRVMPQQSFPDTVVRKPLDPLVKTDKPALADTSRNKPVVLPQAASQFVFAPNEQYYVVLVLNKVDPVFANEARNAFARYNRDTYYNKQFTIENIVYDDENKFMLMSPFKDVDEATAYVEKTRPRTANEILPWLRGGKYYFLVITDKNLEILKVNKNLEGYKNFLNQYVPGKFQ
ncbi:MAG TPA: hypothetical protein VFX58_00655 [Chitinophagaceae bacterium]|nr:hypothetical protein [Chitinophagaceae bacterium]